MIRVGIFFGGRSREREVSFAGGRTVYDNLNKSLFEPVPIFVDSFGNFILLDWQYIYKGSIRDFYPPAHAVPQDIGDIQIYAESLGKLSVTEQEEISESIGRKVEISELPQIIDFAFLVLHGAYGEDGSIQGILDYIGIPYSGSGMMSSTMGMDKSFQKSVLSNKDYGKTKHRTIKRREWFGHTKNADPKSTKKAQKTLYKKIVKEVGLPLVSRPANQGSSIGVGMLMKDDFEVFADNINKAFFIETIDQKFWASLSKEQKWEWLKEVCDLRSHIGLPVKVSNSNERQEEIIYSPKALFDAIEKHFQDDKNEKTEIRLSAIDGEVSVLVEEFIEGEEFSCIVIRNATNDEKEEVVALPPTGIRKGKEIFDYRSKYLPGMIRKVTPIDLPIKKIENIRKACVDLFEYLRFDVYARIDGFIRKDGSIVLNDPNTTSGMLPSSFFFHQAAEIGLNPSQFLTFLIRQSLYERYHSIMGQEHYQTLLNKLESDLENFQTNAQKQQRVAVVMGGYSSERHISVESGRNVYEKLASNVKYEPIPVFLTGDANSYQLYQIPINLLLKDNADDIADKTKDYKKHSLVEKIKKQCENLTQKYGNAETTLDQPVLLDFKALKKKVDFVFIALHGRPGEDGELQKELIKVGLPYNGSSVESSQTTIDKFKCNQLLKSKGFVISDQLLVYKKDWQKDTAYTNKKADKKKPNKQKTSQIPTQNQSQKAFYEAIESFTSYPLIAKPVDDGCSSAVKLIKNREELDAYTHLIFRKEEDLAKDLNLEFAEKLKLKPKEEFPQKTVYLVEQYTTAESASHFLEVTGGLLTRRSIKQGKEGVIEYEVFEPSETLAVSAVLSLEEKFLAGEGQNLTPARFSKDRNENKNISLSVRKDLWQAAQALNIEGYARIDAFVRIFADGNVETIVIEVNSLPGMTPATAIFHQAALNNYKPFEFIDKIIEYGMGQKTS